MNAVVLGVGRLFDGKKTKLKEIHAVKEKGNIIFKFENLSNWMERFQWVAQANPTQSWIILLIWQWTNCTIFSKSEFLNIYSLVVFIRKNAANKNSFSKETRKDVCGPILCCGITCQVVIY